jgi:hypothetical protein
MWFRTDGRGNGGIFLQVIGLVRHGAAERERLFDNKIPCPEGLGADESYSLLVPLGQYQVPRLRNKSHRGVFSVSASRH